MHIVFKPLIAACCLILLTALPASAFGEIRYPDRALNLRDGRSPGANWVGSLVPGQPVRVAFLQNGWVAVFEPAATDNTEEAAVGFANLKYLKTIQGEQGAIKWGSLRQATKDGTIRSRASGLSEQVGALSAGQRVRIDFPDDDWVMVFPQEATIRSKMGAYGFVQRKVLGAIPKKAEAGRASTEPIAQRARNDKRDVYTAWGNVVTAAGSVPVYRERNDGSRKVTTLTPGQRVRIDFPKDGWVAVFEEEERLRKEYRAMGFARQEDLESRAESSVSLSETLAAATDSIAGQDAESESRETVVIDRERFAGAKRPDPEPDKTAHGYQYKILKKGQARKQGESWITLKVFLATTKLPNREALEDFATTLWKQNRRAMKKMAVLIYLPGMDTEDISYGVVQFGTEELEESWFRKTTLFGTDFL